MLKSCFVVATMGLALLAAMPQFALAEQMQHDGHKHHGLVAIKTSHDRFLQGYTNGTIHGSNNKRKSEETWVLVESKNGGKKIGLRNFRTGNYLAPVGPKNVKSDRKQIYEWTLKKLPSGKYLIRAGDGRCLRSNAPGTDEPGCGGEVWLDRCNENNPPPEFTWAIHAAPGEPDGKKDVDWGAILNIAADVGAIILTLAF
jgi:hypothetical protein